MRPIVLIVVLLALPAAAENTLTDRDRELLGAQQRIRQEQIDRARARCIEQRGVDCDSEQGLQEWLLLDMNREQALLNRYGIAVPSAGAGASAPGSVRERARALCLQQRGVDCDSEQSLQEWLLLVPPR
jgi:hypothetical protein